MPHYTRGRNRADCLTPGFRPRDRSLAASLIAPLQTEGMDMSQPSSSSYPSSGYLTPSSSAYDGRRDSVASMQSSASYAHSFSSNNSSYCSTQMPPTPHSAREPLPEEWMLVNSGMPFENSSQEASAHDFEDFSADAWANPLAYTAKARSTVPGRRSEGWGLNESVNLENAFRVAGHDNDAIMSGSGDMGSAFESNMAPRAVTRTLQPAAEIYPSTDMLYMPHATTSAFPIPALTSEAYDDAPVNTTVGLDYEWHAGPAAPFDLPTFENGVSALVQPTETFVSPDDRTFEHMHSDSLDDSFASFDGYSSSTSPGSIVQPRIKEERDDDFETSARRSRSFMESPIRRNSRKEKRPTGVIKRKRMPNQLDTYYARLDESGCPVEVKCQTGLEKDPFSGRLVSATGETKKQRCRFEGCVKTFARPEHLKRHENTHSKERPFPCVVPCCRRRFSRNDNRKAHYETHLKEALSGKKARNASVSFEDLCTYLTREEPEEEARKMIEKLQNPKSKNRTRDA